MAIALALITKEVYSSLFVGIVIGGIFYAIDAASGFSGFFTHIFNDGMIAQLSDSWNVGILVFLVVLGIMVALMNKAGGSQAFGRTGLCYCCNGKIKQRRRKRTFIRRFSRFKS